MNILLIGAGGREHALAWKMAQSPLCEKLFIAPGNAGTALIGQNVAINASDFEAVYEFTQKENIVLVVIGPEQPLVEGLADFLRGVNIAVIGPGKKGAELEGSKEYSKYFMQKHGITTARFQSFSALEIADAKEYVRSMALPVVIKASGLAAGKGVVIAEDLATADKTVDEMLSGSLFGLAGETIVIEEFLHGIEMSVFILTDGKSYKLLPSAKDYKRIFEGDKGPNTGGMGAVSPVPFATNALMQKIKDRIISPTLSGLQEEEIHYCGFIFFGIMVVNGEPYLLEYNCRMGDPETEVVMPRISSDLVELLWAAETGNLAEKEITISSQTCTTVMLVAGGYPDVYQKGNVITGTENVEDSLLFYAGVGKKNEDLITQGGRVIAVSSLGETITHALTKSYRNADKIHFSDKFYRKDIGQDLL